MDTIKNIDQNSISISDNLKFHTHLDVLRFFGVELKIHRRATHAFSDDWMIWFPKIYKNIDFINELSDDGETITMRQLPTSIILSDKVFSKDEPGERIVFAHIKDSTTRDKSYKFVGIFDPLEGNMRYASCRRTATKLYFDKKGRFSTEPLVN